MTLLRLLIDGGLGVDGGSFLDIRLVRWLEYGMAVSSESAVFNVFYAGVAQLAEQLICNQQVGGSTPFASSKQYDVPVLV
jgi:hypothetical protein